MAIGSEESNVGSRMACNRLLMKDNALVSLASSPTNEDGYAVGLESTASFLFSFDLITRTDATCAVRKG